MLPEGQKKKIGAWTESPHLGHGLCDLYPVYAIFSGETCFVFKRDAHRDSFIQMAEKPVEGIPNSSTRPVNSLCDLPAGDSSSSKPWILHM